MTLAPAVSAPRLMTPFSMRSLTFRNRIGVSPMCMFACDDRSGDVTDWHVVHYGQFALGGAGFIIAEATAVMAEGRVTPSDAGLWDDRHIAPWHRVTDAVHRAGSHIGVQLMHAGRKASVYTGLSTGPMGGHGTVSSDDGGWPTIGAMDEPFGELASPLPATTQQLENVVDRYGEAARRAVDAGFDFIEVHAAHGYLLHEFLSPVTNSRSDEWGRERSLLLERVVRVVRAAIPEGMPLLVRLSVDDVAAGGSTAADSASLSARLQKQGVDVIDCSSGGLISGVEYHPSAGYQVPGSETVRAAGVPTAAVGLIRDPSHANQIVADEQADVILLGREMLRDPAWARRAEKELTGTATIEPRYARAYRER